MTIPYNPSQIIEIWQLAFPQIFDNNDMHLDDVVHRYLPPFEVNMLKSAYCWFRQKDFNNLDIAGVSNENLDIATQLTLNADRKDVTRYTHRFPLFYAIHNYFPRVHLSCDANARNIMIAVVYSVFNVDYELSLDRYYQDILAIRDILRILKRIGSLDNVHTLEKFGDTLLKITSHVPRSLNSQELKKVNTCLQLMEENRFVGQRIRRAPQQSRGCKRNFLRAAFHLRESASDKSKRRGHHPRRGLSSLAERNDFCFANLGESEDDDALVPFVKRASASSASGYADQKAVRQLARWAPIANISSFTDVHKLPESRVLQVFDVLSKDPAYWCMAALLTTTGLPVDRVFGIKVGDEPVDTVPVINRNGLSYRLYRGIPGKGDDAGIILLPLPSEALDVLIAWTRRSSQTAKNTFAKRVWRHFQVNGGPIPTAQALSASARDRLRSLGFDEMVVHALSGALTGAATAPTYYQRLSQKEVADSFACAWNSLAGVCSIKDPAWFVSASDTDNSSDILTNRAQDFERWQALLHQVRHKARSGRERLRRVSSNQVANHHFIFDIAELSALHAYIAFMLASGSRPIGRQTEIACVQQTKRFDYWYISDKHSRSYRERRLIPVPIKIRSVFDAHEALIHQCIAVLRENGLIFYDDGIKSSLPHFFRISGENFFLCPIDNETAWKIANRHALNSSSFASNASRHTLATYLRGIISQDVIDSQLGHESQCVFPFHPTRVDRCWPPDDLISALEKFLTEVGVKRLNLTPVHHDAID